MENSQQNIEKVIVFTHVHRYMQRLHSAMKGMKFLKAEKCRLNYWQRFLSSVRDEGYYPMWEDFKNYLKVLPMSRPGISEDEFEVIIDRIAVDREVKSEFEKNLSEVLFEIAFNDYLKESFKGLNYLSKDQQTYRISAFWRRMIWIYLACKHPINYEHYQGLIKCFEFPEALRIDQVAFERAKDEVLEYFEASS